MFDFLEIKIIDIIDIILVGLLIYQLYKIIRGTSAISIFVGILVLYIGWIVVTALNMNLLSSILGQILGVGIIALIILFQQEIRRFLLHLGNRSISHSTISKITRIFFPSSTTENISREFIDELSDACQRMSETKTGALIVLKHSSSLENIIDTGDIVDARLSSRLLQNLFFKNSPLHDGAIVINNGRIVAARCTIPIVENPSIPAQYGMRHRAAVSVSESTDATALVVSEETGNISFVINGELKLMTNLSELKLTIENSYR
jgi:diadenylate cyclase